MTPDIEQILSDPKPLVFELKECVRSLLATQAELVASVSELVNCANSNRDHAELKRARSLLRSLGRMP